MSMSVTRRSEGKAETDLNWPVAALALGVATMFFLGFLRHDMGVGRALGFWASLGLSLPLAGLVEGILKPRKEFFGGLCDNAFRLGWPLMISLGVIHHEFHAGRAIGFWPSVGLMLPLATVVAALRQEEDHDDSLVGALLLGAPWMGWTIMIAIGIASHSFGRIHTAAYFPCLVAGTGIALVLHHLTRRRRQLAPDRPELISV